MKKYIKPQLNCIIMNTDAPILTGSKTIQYDPNNTPESKDSWGEAMGKTTVNGSIWNFDDDED